MFFAGHAIVGLSGHRPDRTHDNDFSDPAGRRFAIIEGAAGKFQTVLLAWKGNSPSSKMRAVFRNDTLISKAQLGLK